MAVASQLDVVDPGSCPTPHEPLLQRRQKLDWPECLCGVVGLGLGLVLALAPALARSVLSLFRSSSFLCRNANNLVNDPDQAVFTREVLLNSLAGARRLEAVWIEFTLDLAGGRFAASPNFGHVLIGLERLQKLRVEVQICCQREAQTKAEAHCVIFGLDGIAAEEERIFVDCDGMLDGWPRHWKEFFLL